MSSKFPKAFRISGLMLTMGLWLIKPDLLFEAMSLQLSCTTGSSNHNHSFAYSWSMWFDNLLTLRVFWVNKVAFHCMIEPLNIYTTNGKVKRHLTT